MTVETKTNRKTAVDDWAPTGRRQGEYVGWNERPPTTEEATEEVLVFPSITPPPIWPRVFPGI